MKKIISILISIMIFASVLVIPTTVGGATNDVNKFKSSKFLKCGGYYFFVSDNSMGKSTLYRVNSNGKNKKSISSVSFYTNEKLLSYKNMLYFYNDSGVWRYNPKNGKKSLFKKGNYAAIGICSKGIISKDYSTGLTLIGFNKKTKKINTSSYSYMCANSKYIFYYACKASGYKYKTIIKRYNLKNYKSEKASTLSFKSDNYNSYFQCWDSHVFKKSIIFSLGSYEGTGLYYSGSVYKMNSKGTGIKKISNQSIDNFTPGKGCVYGILQPKYDYSLVECYKITPNGKCTKVKNTKGFRQSTSNNYCIYAKKTGSIGENFYTRNISNSKSKKVFNAKSFIKKSDTKKAYVQGCGIASYGDRVMFEITVNSPEGGMGWRPLLLRKYTYMVNLKTGSKHLLATIRY